MSDCRRNPTRDDPASSHARHRDSVQSGERATDPSAAVAFIQGRRNDGMAPRFPGASGERSLVPHQEEMRERLQRLRAAFENLQGGERTIGQLLRELA